MSDENNQRYSQNNEKNNQETKSERYSNTVSTVKRYQNLYLTRHRETVSPQSSFIKTQINHRRNTILYRSSQGLRGIQRRPAKPMNTVVAGRKATLLRNHSPVVNNLNQTKDRLNAYVGYAGYKGGALNRGPIKGQNGNSSVEKKVVSLPVKAIKTGIKIGVQVAARKIPGGLTGSGRKIVSTQSNEKKKLSKLARDKVDASLKKNVTSKNVFRNKMKEMLVDTIGRNDSGELNLVGVILAIILLIPVLFLLIKIVLIASVVITIISIILAIWSFIASIFTVKTEDTVMEQAYRMVAQLDAQRNKEVYELYNQLSIDEENNEVYFIVNGIRSNPENFLFNSNGDTYLYYLNAKYENYDIDRRARTNLGYSRVRDEIRGIHHYTFNWETEFEEQEVEQTVIVENEETGEMEEILEPRTNRIAVIRVTWASIADYLETNPGEMSEEEHDKFVPIQDLDRFENKIFLDNPLGSSVYSTVIEKYSYRGRDPSTNHDTMVLQANDGDTVYAPGDGTVVSATNNRIVINVNLRMRITITNLKNVTVRDDQRLYPKDVIAEAAGNLEIRMEERIPILWWENRKNVYPAAYIDNLTFSYPEGTGFYDPSGGITGDLINPPDSVLQWRELVVKACERHGIPGFENIILAIIWEESGGNPIFIESDDGHFRFSMDIMQASESLGLPPNSIKTAEESIDVGVAYFAEGLRLVEENNLDRRTAIQAYNFGHGFINWLVEANLDYSFDTAKIFSRDRSNRETVLYNNPIARRRGYTWRYNYGNMFYVDLVTQHIMMDTGSLVRIAREELGYPNGDKYWRWFGLNFRAEWCAIFVSWVAEQAGYLEQGRIPRSASTLEMVRWFTERGQYRTATEGYVPREGDIIFFDWSGGRTGKDHVGIVEFSDGRVIQTIEGNSGNAVRRQTYMIDSPVISGYGISRVNEIE